MINLHLNSVIDGVDHVVDHLPASERLPRLAYAALALLFLISLTYLWRCAG